MRWRQSFIAEISQALQQLGLRACPVCGSADSLSIGPFPVYVLDGGPPDGDDSFLGEDHDYDLTFAVRIECTACGLLMLFNSSKYRTGDEPILWENKPRNTASSGSDGLLSRGGPDQS